MTKRVRVFTERHPFVGPAFWILSVQYFLTQLLVANAWPTAYSWRLHAISDLGNTVCGDYGEHSERYVCSLHHGWMNVSFVVLGVTVMIGSILLYESFKRTKGTLLGFWFMGLAGFGTVIVGLVPENVIPGLHAAGAFLPFVLGNIALVVLGLSLDIPSLFRRFTVAFGATALVALVFFLTGFYPGVELGGMERLVAYPQTLWLIVFGVYVSADQYRDDHKKQ